MQEPTLREKCEATFGLDVRSLALLRVALALMVFMDLASRLEGLVAHYTDAGVWPRSMQQTFYLDPYPGRFSFHMLSGESALQVGLLVLLAVAAIGLALGFWTRVCMLLVWVLTISLHSRNELVSTGVDAMQRMAYFWALWLPLGAVLSLDARRRPHALPRRAHYLSFASFALIAQVCMIYWFSVVHKDHPQWRSEYTAVHYALHIDAYATWFGEWLRGFPLLTRWMTMSVFWCELLGPFLLFAAGLLSCLPRCGRLLRFQGPLRTLGVLAFLLLHAGLAAGLALGTFSWFAMLLWLGLLPDYFWDLLASWKRLPVGLTLSSEPTGPRTGPRKFAFWAAQGLCAVALVAVVLVNLETVNARRFSGYVDGGAWFLPSFRVAVNALRLDQHWGLFAPNPRTKDGWYVLVATQRDGKQLDLRADDLRLTWERPERVSSSYPSFRWRVYYRNLRRDGRLHAQQRASLVDSLCNRWNETHAANAQLVSMEIWFMERSARREGGHRSPKKRDLLRRQCPAPARELLGAEGA